MKAPCLLLALAGPLLSSCTRAPAPDVILVTWDTVRADRAGPDAVVQGITPRLDALAAQGVRFTEARTVVPITLPAHSTLLTGLRPDETGVRTNGLFALGDEAVTLAESARDEGWTTGAFVSAAVLDSDYGLAQGFSTYDDDVGSGEAGTFPQRRADATVDRALAWLRSRTPEERVFLWVHLFDPHLPWTAPEAHAAAHPTDPYAAEIAFTDAQTGRLLDGLQSLGRLDRALVVVTSDHGEGLGEHGEDTHAHFAYDSTLRVPLVFRAGAETGIRTARGAAIRGPATLGDLAPTLRELLGWTPRPTSGVSLAPSLVGGGPLPPRDLFVECVEPAFAFGTAPVFGVIDEEGRSWFDVPRRERYDLADDPGQTRNLYDHDTMAMVADARFGRVERKWPPRSSRTLDTAELERLAALGYVGGGADTSAVHPIGQGPDAKDLIPVAALVQANDATMSPDSALQRAEDLRIRFGPVPILAMVQADALDALGRRSEAIEALLEPARLHPSERRLAQKLSMLREAEAADRALLAGIRDAALERPGDLGVSFDLALVLHRLGEVAEAEPLYRRVLETNPKDAEARVNLARILGAASGPTAALEFLGLHPEPSAAVLCATGRLLRRDAPDSPAGEAALRDCLDHGGRLTPEEREALR